MKQEDVLVIEGSKVWSGIYFLICSAVFVLILWILFWIDLFSREWDLGWALMILGEIFLSGYGVYYFGVRLINNVYIKLDGEGFEKAAAGKSRRTSWVDVDHSELRRTQYLLLIKCFPSDSYKKEMEDIRISKGWVARMRLGRLGIINVENYKLGAEMCDLMNEWCIKSKAVDWGYLSLL